jgi:hypothetical protein
MDLFARQPARLRHLTAGYLAAWLVSIVVWRLDIVPAWLIAVIQAGSVPLAASWIVRMRAARADAVSWSVVATATYVLWWCWSLVLSDLPGLSQFRPAFESAGLFGLFVIGLGWVVWYLEGKSREIELRRIERALAGGAVAVRVQDHDVLVADRSWNPLDPQAWFYGREARKLKQSMLAFFLYGLVFWIGTTVITLIGGCHLEYEMPAGGGEQKTVAQQVRIQKVIRKKYVVNPFSAISFAIPPIEEVKLQLQEVTAHQYTIGHGDGAGAGFAGGTSKGKVRLIRLEYDGGDWDLNFGIGGDNNMLLEYGLLTQQKTADKSESIRISQLAAFPKDKAPPLVFLTGQRNLSVANNELKTLREYLVDKHGLLFASSGSQHFHNQFMSLMSRVLPEVRPVTVPMDDQIHRVPFALPRMPYVVPHGGREALGWMMDGRWVCYYHPGDVSDAWADGHSGVSADIYNGCFQLGANVINYAHVEHSKWLVNRRPSR